MHTIPHHTTPHTAGASEATSPLAGRRSPGAEEGGGSLNDAELHLITSVVSQVLSQSNLAGLLGGSSSGAGGQQVRAGVACGGQGLLTKGGS